MKHCPKCDTSKDESKFYNNKCHIDGKEPYCKPCKKEAVAAYQKTDEGKVTAAKAQRKWINTPQGRVKKRKIERAWRKTEIGAKTTKRNALKRYYRDPEYHRLKAKARNHGVSMGILKQILERDKTCQLCHTDKDLQFDHIYPVSQGGKGSLENLQLLCGSCNNFKSNHFFLPDGGMMLTGKQVN